MKYSIAYEDESLLLIDKPQGLACTPGKTSNLCDLIFHDHPELKMIHGFKDNEGGLLNRLDNETGGIVFFAKTTESFQYYSKLMKDEQVFKYYTALVEGVLDNDNGIINAPIAHHLKNPKKMTLSDHKKRYRGNPQTAETEYKVIQKFENQTLLEILIKKGVRHQIRIHLLSIGHPVVNDSLYSQKYSEKYKFQCLYAHKVFFKSFSGKEITVKVDVKFK